MKKLGLRPSLRHCTPAYGSWLTKSAVLPISAARPVRLPTASYEPVGVTVGVSPATDAATLPRRRSLPDYVLQVPDSDGPVMTRRRQLTSLRKEPNAANWFLMA
jgi:hypothetical protein